MEKIDTCSHIIRVESHPLHDISKTPNFYRVALSDSFSIQTIFCLKQHIIYSSINVCHLFIGPSIYFVNA